MANMLNLSKAESDNLLNLRKQTLETLCLTKRDLTGLTARVGVALDYSGSMGGLYRNGTVQAALERLYPIAEAWDDNGEMELWIFDNGFHRMPNISRENYYGYVDNVIMRSGYRMGGTCYAPVMQDITNKYTREEPAQLPNYIIFITDGENSDRAQATQTITKISRSPIFWQFVGIGGGRFSFLEQLDELEGRYIDNANFFAMNDILSGDDTQVYDKLLAEFPSWLKDPKVQEMIRNGGAPQPKGGLFSRLFG